MKKQLAKLTLTAALGLAITLTLTACGKGGDKYAGIYEYAYPYGSEENAYIVLSEENGKVTGFYYGTSDEFDEAREGYSAEYFVAPMANLKINGDTITFELKVKKSDFLTKLIDLKITSTQEAIKAGNTNGQGPIRIDHKNMVGYISADKKTILIKGDKEEGYRDDRSFVKTETINRKEPSETASESQPSDYLGCIQNGSPITIEAVFFKIYENVVNYHSEGCSLFRLANGEEVQMCGEVSNDVKIGDKVSVTYQVEKCREETEDVIYYDSYRIISLKKIGGNAKLLKCIADESGKCFKNFEYDEQNRIVKINGETIVYADNLVTVKEEKSVTNYAIKGNKVTKKSSNQTLILTLNKEGYIDIDKYVTSSGESEHSYQYRDGNLVEYRYYKWNKYDNKPSPLSNSNTPKWLVQQLVSYHEGDHYASKNNVLEWEFTSDGEYAPENQTNVYKYEYDSDGFPIKRTVQRYENGGQFIETTTIGFVYIGE